MIKIFITDSSEGEGFDSDQRYCRHNDMLAVKCDKSGIFHYPSPQITKPTEKVLIASLVLTNPITR